MIRTVLDSFEIREFLEVRGKVLSKFCFCIVSTQISDTFSLVVAFLSFILLLTGVGGV